MPSPAQDENTTLTIGKAAKMLGVSPSTLRRFEEQGLISSQRGENGYRFFVLTDVISLKRTIDEKKDKKREVKHPVITNGSYTLPSHSHSEKSEKLNAARNQAKRALDPLASPQSNAVKTTPNEAKIPNTKLISAGFIMASAVLMLFSAYMLTPSKAKKALNQMASSSLYNVGSRIASALNLELDQSDPFTQFGEKQLLGAVLGQRVTLPEYELVIAVPTTIKNNFSVEGTINSAGLATLSGGIITDNQDIDAGTGVISAGTVTTGNLTFTTPGQINNLLALDDTSKGSLESILELSGDVTGTLDNTTVTGIGGVNIGTIDDSDGNLLYLDGGEVVSGLLSDLDTTQITKLGTITTGTWQADVLEAKYGGTGLSSYTAGDLIYASGATTLSKVIIGTEGYILTSAGGIPAWSNVNSALGGNVFLHGGNSFGTTAILGTNDAYGLIIETAGIGRAIIDSGGNIGIGNTAPLTKVHLGDSSQGPSYVSGETESMYIEGNLEVTGTIYGGAIIGPTSYDEGSVTFIGLDGYLDQNNTQFYWNDTTERLGIGTSSPNYKLDVRGTVGIDGNMTFVNDHTIAGTGTLTINPTGNLYLQSSSYYIDENGILTVAKVKTTAIEYSGNITLDANSSAGTTTVTVTNKNGTQVANLEVEGDVNIAGGKLTLASGETIDAETANQLAFRSDGTIRVVAGTNLNMLTGSDVNVETQNFNITLGDNTGTREFAIYDSTGVTKVGVIDSDGHTTIASTLTVQSGGAAITGSSTITGSITATQDLIAASQLRVGSATNTVYNYIADDLSAASANMDSDLDLFVQGDLQIGGILIAPVEGKFGYWTRTGTTLSPTTGGDNITTTGIITGNTVTDGTLSITGGNLTTSRDVESATGTITTLDGTTLTYTTANVTTLDLGTNTIYDGNLTGNWNFNGGNITNTGNITAAGTTGFTLSGTGADLYIGAIGLNDNSTTSSGASLIGLYDNAMDNILGNTNLQNAIKVIDTAIGNRDYTGQNHLTTSESLTTSLEALDNALTDLEIGATGLWQDEGTYIYASNYTNFVITDTGRVGIGITNPGYALTIAGAISATRTITSYDNVITVDRNGGGDYTSITNAITAINTAGDAGAANPYVIWVMAGTYDEDVTLPDYVSIQGQGWKTTIIDGRLTVGDGSYIESIAISPTGMETIAVTADPDGAKSYMSNTFVSLTTSTNAPTYLIRFTGTTDFEIANSLLEIANNNAGGSAKAYNFYSNAATGDLKITNTKAKTGCANNNNCILSLNDSSIAGADIIFAGEWAVTDDTSPVAAVNNNANGQIKLNINYENDAGDYAMYTTTGNNVIINPFQTDKLAIHPGTGLTTGDLANISYSTANTLSGSLTGLNMDLSTNVTDGDNAVTGLNLTLPDSGTATSKGINISGSADYGFYVEGETKNYLSGNLGIGTTNPSYTLDVQGNAGIASGSDLYTYSVDNYYATVGNRDYTEANFVTDSQTFTASIDAIDQQLQDLTSGSAGLWQEAGATTYLDSITNNLAIGGTGATAKMYFAPASSSLTLNPYGALTGNTGEFRSSELTVNGTEYTGFKAPDSLDSTIMYTLPNTSGSTDYVLTYQTGGSLEWKNVTGVGGAGDITDVGSITSGAAFSDGNADDDWLGLGAAAGRIEFDDQATDEVNILSAKVGIGTSTPSEVLDVVGNIAVSGTVDSRDIATDGSNLDNLYTTIGLSALTSAEVDQLENIGASIISAAQWGYVGNLNQNLATTSAPTFATLNTGQGAYELYAMDQDVKTTDEVTFYSATLSEPSANRLIATDASRKLVSTSASSWLTGTANQIAVANDGDGTATLSLEQNINTTAAVTFGSLRLGATTQVSGVLDEDTMSSNSNTSLATQQSIKAYVDTRNALQNELVELDDVTVSSAAEGDLLIYSGGTWYNKALSGNATITAGGALSLADNTVDNAELVDALTYSGALNLTGTWSIGSTQVTATAAELNILDNATVNTTELNYLDGATVTSGGVIFGNGTKLTQNTSQLYWNNTDNRLGIGTSAPSYALDVNGAIQIATGSELYSFGSATLGNRTYTTPIYVANGQTFTASVQALDDQVYALSQGQAGLWIDQTTYIQASNYTSFVIEDGGDVGIGTTNPTEKLHVVGNILLTGTLSNGVTTLSGSNFTSTGGFDFDLADNSGANSLAIRDSDNSNVFTIDSIGNLSLYGGSASFAVNNGANTGFMITNTGTGDSFRVNDVSSDTTPFVIDADGKVGIGTTSPGAKLDVSDANQVTDSWGNLAILTTDSYAIDKGGQVTFGGKYSSAGVVAKFASIAGRKENASSGNTAGYLALSTTTSAGGAVLERIRISSTGYVGIGTTGPTAKLNIIGDNDLSSGYSLWARPSGSDKGLIVRNDENVSIGVGGGVANARLHIQGSDAKIRMANLTSNAGEIGLEFAHIPGDATTGIKNAIVSKATGSWTRGDLHFVLNSAGDATNYTVGTDTKMIIKSAGNVGIGTTSPTHKLELTDHTTAAGGIALGTDVELYRSAANSLVLADGDTLTLGSTATNIDLASFFAGYSSVELNSPNPGVLEVSSGSVLINGKWRRNTTKTTINLWQATYASGESAKTTCTNEGETCAGTNWFVYAVADTSATTFTIVLSEKHDDWATGGYYDSSGSAPTGLTNYKLLGYFQQRPHLRHDSTTSAATDNGTNEIKLAGHDWTYLYLGENSLNTNNNVIQPRWVKFTDANGSYVREIERVNFNATDTILKYGGADIAFSGTITMVYSYGIIPNSVTINDNLDGATLKAGVPLPGMVKVGSIAVDIYEATAWDASADTIDEDLNDLTTNVLASKFGQQVGRNATQYDARRVALRTGKRLLTSAEWLRAISNTPDTEKANPGEEAIGETEDYDDTDGYFGQGKYINHIWHTSEGGAGTNNGDANHPYGSTFDTDADWTSDYSKILAGTAVNSFSQYNVYDGVGNVWEWNEDTREMGEAYTGAVGWRDVDSTWFNWDGSINTLPVTGNTTADNEQFNYDGVYIYTNGSNTKTYCGGYTCETAALRRGGDWDNGARAGVFSLHLNVSPSHAGYYFGLRGAR